MIGEPTPSREEEPARAYFCDHPAWNCWRCDECYMPLEGKYRCACKAAADRAASPGEGEALRAVVERFVADFGLNGSKTGRADYLRWVPLDRIEELRAALLSPLTPEEP